MAYALITGASSGIGWELAHVMAAKEWDLILVARTGEKLNELKTELEKKYRIRAQVIPMDLAKPEAALDLFRKTQGFEVEILVNNAGFGDYGAFADADWKRQRDMIQVNIMALTELTHLFLPSMIQRKSGKILNVASTAAFQPGPLMSVYYATKAFVLSFSEGLYEELQGTGVSVTALCPGPTKSGFQQAANMGNVALFETTPLPSSRDVALYGYRALMQRKPVAIHGTVNKMMASSVRFVPRAVTRKLVRKLQEKRA
ncbi:MAG: SDR family NAD(P)-dependent oxidoreductase [Pseudobdellovibrionaceae bacterium]